MLNQYLKKTLFSVFFIAYCFSIDCIAALPTSCPSLSSLKKAELHSAEVDWVPDGDTIHTKNGLKLRLLNINTPEINPTSKLAAEPFSKAAQKRLVALIGPSNKVFWITDKRKKDKYKRELAYVFNSAGLFINAQLASEGLAHSLVILPNQNYWLCISESEKQAFKNNRAIWSHSKFQPKTTSQVKPKQGFQLVSGKITQIINSKKNRWLILDQSLWVGIARKDFNNFNAEQLKLKIGDTITLRGYAYYSYEKLRMKLRHPAMIFNIQ
jgi:endonuclease YncB( thermonuclease family)